MVPKWGVSQLEGGFQMWGKDPVEASSTEDERTHLMQNKGNSLLNTPKEWWAGQQRGCLQQGSGGGRGGWLLLRRKTEEVLQCMEFSLFW